MDQVLIGKLYGAASLGIYRQAHQLILWPVQQLITPLNLVAESTLSFLQDSPERYRSAYQKLLTTVNLLMMPLTLFAAIYSSEIVLLVLGDRWIDAVPIFRVLALAAFIRPASDSTGLLLTTCGRTRRYLALGIVTGLILLVAFSVGAIWGALGVAYGALAATCTLLALRLSYGFEGTPVTVRAFFQALKTPIVASAAMAIVLVMMNTFVSIGNPFAVLALAVPVSVGSYLLAWILIPGGKGQLGVLASDLGVSLRLDRPSAQPEAAIGKQQSGSGGESA
jgi:O-antigen/teichoic acid export membrane protein